MLINLNLDLDLDLNLSLHTFRSELARINPINKMNGFLVNIKSFETELGHKISNLENFKKTKIMIKIMIKIKIMIFASRATKG